MFILKDSIDRTVLQNHSKIDFMSDLKRFLVNEITEILENFTDEESLNAEAGMVVELIKALRTLRVANDINQLEEVAFKANYTITKSE